jgi:hypothetical protein
VKRVTPEKHFELQLDHSVSMCAATTGPGNKTIFTQNGGALTRFDGTGQVIAIIDTGHRAHAPGLRHALLRRALRDAHAATCVPCAPPDSRTRKGRTIRRSSTSSPDRERRDEDDVGHGTHCATDAAG